MIWICQDTFVYIPLNNCESFFTYEENSENAKKYN